MARFSVSTEEWLQVADLIAYEADLLDDRQFDAWLDLFTDDARYAVHVRELPTAAAARDGQPVDATMLFEDNKAFLALRVQRLESRLAHAERPPSATRHIYTNLLITRPDRDVDDEVEVQASFVVYQARAGLADQLFFGKRRDLLRLVAGEWRIARRTVVLDHNPLPRTLTIFF